MICEVNVLWFEFMGGIYMLILVKLPVLYRFKKISKSLKYLEKSVVRIACETFVQTRAHLYNLLHPCTALCKPLQPCIQLYGKQHHMYNFCILCSIPCSLCPTLSNHVQSSTSGAQFFEARRFYLADMSFHEKVC